MPPRFGVAAGLDVPAGEHDFRLIDHFPLPDNAWWEDFYTPMTKRIGELRDKYVADSEALAVLDQLAREPEMHRLYSEYYAYEFFVARRDSVNS